jgi:hypothetical protein
MEFCILSRDIEKLERYGRLSTTHLMLAQVTDQRYWQFYHERRKEGDWLILDNGAFEGKIDNVTLRNRIATEAPDVVVLPDYLDQRWQATYTAARRFLDDNCGRWPSVSGWMYVPQSVRGDIVGWSISLMNALDDQRINWVGLPRALAYLYTDDRFIRARIAEHLKKYRPDIKLHALGMVHGDVAELSALRETKCVESIDSHYPIDDGENDEILSRLEACGVYVNARAGNTT